MDECEHCKDPWQKWMKAPNGEYMHRAVHGCEIVWSKCSARNGVPVTEGTVGLEVGGGSTRPRT